MSDKDESDKEEELTVEDIIGDSEDDDSETVITLDGDEDE